MADSLLGLEGKVALVTGGALGIGKGCATMLAKAGCHVLIADINEEAGHTTERELKKLGRKALFVKADVRQRKDIDGMIAAAVKHLGGLDVCVNNVGGMPDTQPTRFLDSTPEFYNNIVEANLTATYWCIFSEAKSMVARKVKGAIINIASIAAIRAVIKTGPYAASKAGINGLTRLTAFELGEHGIRVNTIMPGSVATERYRVAFPKGTHDPVTDRMLLKRFAEPSEYGAVAVFLASNLASYVTGQSLVVDGGTTLEMPGSRR